MKITLLAVGKTDAAYLEEGIAIYAKRISRYINFSLEIIPDVKKTKKTSELQQKGDEGELILKRINPGKELHLFDENGKNYSSAEFAEFLQKKMASGLKELVLVTGGPYGFPEEVKKQAVSKISLSRLTFSHQMVRLLCVEQIYRAFTILNGEPYHHD